MFFNLHNAPRATSGGHMNNIYNFDTFPILITLVNVYVDLVVFTRIAGTS